jgi:hypothetical protein
MFDDLVGAQDPRARSRSTTSAEDRFVKGSTVDPGDDRFMRRPSSAGAQAESSERGMLDGFDREFSQGPLENEANFEPEAGMKLFRKSPDGMPSRRDSDYARVVNKGGQHWAYVEESQQAQARTPEEEAAHKLQLRDETRYLHGGQELSDEEGQNWDQNRQQRYAYDSRAQKVADPQAGWDKPKGGIVKTCGSACHATCWSLLDSSGRSTSFPFSKMAPALTRATRCGALTARHLAWADSMSLNAMATPAALDPGPLVMR